MQIPVLFIHSAGPQSLYEGSDGLAAYLQKTLGERYRMIHPKMPDPENPRYEQWKERLKEEIARLEDEVILVGHSLGASILLKYLSEETMVKPVAGLFLVAVPFWGDKDWEIDEFVLRRGFASKLSNIQVIFLYHSRDDVWVPFKHLDHYAKELPEAIIRVLKGDEHEFYDGLPELVADIKEVCANLSKRNPNS